MHPTDSLFDKLTRLPSIPSLVQTLINSLNDPDADLHPLIADLKRDQAISARVLRLANSSYYGVSRKVGAIDEAVALIGLNALRTLVITSGITATFQDVPGVAMGPFWRHSIVSAMVSRHWARKARLNGEYAYTAGLIHRIGELLIAIAIPEAGRALDHTLHEGPALALLSAERAMLGTDHCEVGAEQIRQWNFPPIIRNAVRWYAEPLHPEAENMSSVIALASYFAWALVYPCSDERVLDGCPRALLEHLQVADVDLAEELAQFKNYAAQAEVFA